MNSRRRWLFCAFASLAVVGCLSPTLPLPPPGEPEVTGPSEMGLVRLEGEAPRGSWITAYNRDLGEGRFQDVKNGRYGLELPAAVGHSIVLWYEIDGEKSLPLELEIRAR